MTLTGTPGVGKTRLALRVVAELNRPYPGGVWFVELDAVADGAYLAHTVAQTLEIHDQSGRDPVAPLVEFLRAQETLLVWDNCEHLVKECAVLAKRLLREVAHLRILTTSRAALRVSGEHVWTVLPLSIPEERPTPPGTGGEPCQAVRLFTERAAAIVPEFAATAAADREPVLSICRLLDGLPLAIELAAARIRMLSPRQLLSRLDDRFRLLTNGDHTTSARHRTLWTTINWSFGLCGLAERTLWTRISVFDGQFSLDAAEEICSGDGIARGDVLELLDGLIGQSILLREEYAGQTCYRLLNTLRQYGHDRLHEAGEDQVLRRRHADWYLSLACRAGEDWFGPDEVAWLGRLRREHANLRAALDFHLTDGESQAASSLATALCFYWISWGLVAEGRQWLDRALAKDVRPGRSRAEALWAAGYLASMQQDLDWAAIVLMEAAELARQLDEPSIEARATERLGAVALFAGDLRNAAALQADAFARYVALGEAEHPSMVIGRVVLSGLRVLQGDLAGASELGEDALAICQARGDVIFLPYAWWALARAEWARGDYGQAGERARQCLRLLGRAAPPADLMLAVELLAWQAEESGEAERAAVLLGAAHQMCHTFGIAGLFRSALVVGPHDECETRIRQELGVPGY
ncbi:MAG TPA: AAA family ATPase, partial [Amycolatopsis sp.]|nr:AAA family ATPase [Amycolatopsis sp.]